MTSMALLWAASMGVAAAMADGPLRDALERGILAHALVTRFATRTRRALT